MINTFDSTFENSCMAGDCSGWNTKGFYEVKTDPEGAHQLHLTVNINSPLPLDAKMIKGSWFLATTNHRAELFGCRWMPFSQDSLCKSALAQKDLKSWSKETRTWRQTISYAPELWAYKSSKKHIESNKMTMEAVRKFDLGDKYTQWKLGDKHSMVVRFVYHDRRELAGESDKIVLELTEKATETGPKEGEIDDEAEILPGVTTVIEPEKEEEEEPVEIEPVVTEPVVTEPTVVPEPAGTTWPIQMEQLGDGTNDDSLLTLSPALMIVSGAVFAAILLMIICSAIFCCRRKKNAQDSLKKTRDPSIIVQRASQNSEDSPQEESNAPKAKNDYEDVDDIEATQNPITAAEVPFNENVKELDEICRGRKRAGTFSKKKTNDIAYIFKNTEEGEGNEDFLETPQKKTRKTLLPGQGRSDVVAFQQVELDNYMTGEKRRE